MEGTPGTVTDRSKTDLKESDEARKLRKKRENNRIAQQKFRQRRKENGPGWRFREDTALALVVPPTGHHTPSIASSAPSNLESATSDGLIRDTLGTSNTLPANQLALTSAMPPGAMQFFESAMPSPSNMHGVQYPMAHPAGLGGSPLDLKGGVDFSMVASRSSSFQAMSMSPFSISSMARPTEVTTQVAFPTQTSSSRSATEQPNDDREYQPGGPGPAGALLRNDYRVPPQVSQLDRSPPAQNRQSQQLLHDGVQPRQNSEPPVTFGDPRPVPGPSFYYHLSPKGLYKLPYKSFEGNPYANTNLLRDKIPESDNSSKPTIRAGRCLTSFEPSTHTRTVLDQNGRPAKLEVTAHLYGMFFYSEIAGGDTIVCYRRNNFKISGSVTCPVGPLSVVNIHGESVAIVSQEMTVSATESVNQHSVQLIVAPRTRTPLANSADLPAPIPIDLDNVDKNNDAVSQQLAWSRLQFRVATACNDRRRLDPQQHFVLRLRVISTLADRSRLCTTESATLPIMVRGGSPNAFKGREGKLVVASSPLPGSDPHVSPSQTKDHLMVDRRTTTNRNLPPPRPPIRNSYSMQTQLQQHSGNAVSATSPFAQLQRTYAAQNTTPHYAVPELTTIGPHRGISSLLTMLPSWDAPPGRSTDDGPAVSGIQPHWNAQIYQPDDLL